MQTLSLRGCSGVLNQNVKINSNVDYAKGCRDRVTTTTTDAFFGFALFVEVHTHHFCVRSTTVDGQTNHGRGVLQY